MTHFYFKKRLSSPGGSFNFEVEYALTRGTRLGILGPSGSGKTTLLRCLAGLERPDEGFLLVEGASWQDSRRRLFLPPQRRRIGLVFQDAALFPHLTVTGNLLFASRDRERAARLLAMVQLTEQAQLYPHQLSGGQTQRTALARALMRDPDLLLLDEPFSALDEDLRAALGQAILDVQTATGITTILVSHSRAEIDRLCTEVLELTAGRLNPDRHRL